MPIFGVFVLTIRASSLIIFETTAITLSISEKVKEKMDKFPEVKWSEVLRKIIISKVKQFKKLE